MWDERIGFLLQSRADYWWEIVADASIGDEPAAEVVAAIREVALPAMRAHMT